MENLKRELKKLLIQQGVSRLKDGVKDGVRKMYNRGRIRERLVEEGISRLNILQLDDWTKEWKIKERMGRPMMKFEGTVI